jgi:heme exporter protein D
MELESWVAPMLIGVVLLAICALWHLNVTSARERRDLLDRLQAPDHREYRQRRAMEAAPPGQSNVDERGKTVLERRPWEQDPRYTDCEIYLDHEAQEVQVIDSEQELVRIDLDTFLARYR